MGHKSKKKQKLKSKKLLNPQSTEFGTILCPKCADLVTPGQNPWPDASSTAPCTLEAESVGDQFNDNDVSCANAGTEQERKHEEILLRRVEDSYNKALAKIKEKGYDTETAMDAILCNGPCVGIRAEDLVTDICNSALNNMKCCSKCKGLVIPDRYGVKFLDLNDLASYTVDYMRSLRITDLKLDEKRSVKLTWNAPDSTLQQGASQVQVPVSAGEGDRVRNAKQHDEQNDSLIKGEVKSFPGEYGDFIRGLTDEVNELDAQLHRAEAAMGHLEKKDAELEAVIQASELSALESARRASEIDKREKESLKNLSAVEKQNLQLLEEIAQEEQKITESKQRILGMEQPQREAQLRLRKGRKDRGVFLALLQEEERVGEGSSTS